MNFDGVVVAFVCLLLLILVVSFWFTIGVTLVVFVYWDDEMIGLWLRVANLRGAFGFGLEGFGFGFPLLTPLNCHLQTDWLYTYISPFNPKL